MQVSIRQNTYRSFGYTVVIAAITALCLTAAVMLSTKPRIDTIFSPIPLSPTRIQSFIIDPPEPPAPRVQLQGLAFINRFDTTTHDVQEVQAQVKDVLSTSGSTGSSTFTVTTSSSSQSVMTSTVGTSPIVTTKPPNDGDDEEIEFSEVEPSVDLHELHSKIEYPLFLQRAGVEGEVRIAVLVSENGKVSATKVLQSTDERFCASAVNAIQHTSFRPGMNNGTAVKSWVVIPIVFSLR